VQQVDVDPGAQEILDASISDPRPIRFIANKLQSGDEDEYDEKMAEVQLDNHLLDHEDRIFLEVSVTDASDFSSRVAVTSVEVGKHRILRATGTSVPNTIAAVLLHVRLGAPQHPVGKGRDVALPGQQELQRVGAGRPLAPLEVDVRHLDVEVSDVQQPGPTPAGGTWAASRRRLRDRGGRPPRRRRRAGAPGPCPGGSRCGRRPRRW